MQYSKGMSENQYNQILSCLTKLIQKLRLNAVFLVDGAGRILAEKLSESEKFDTTILAPLASGSYSAANEMARQLGEKSNVKMMLYENDNKNVFISSVTSDVFLVIVFETGVALGMVRLFAKRTLLQLQPILLDDSANQFDELFDQHFQGLLNEKLNQSFLDE
ncbi:roadblock/LC7 domain-containing protein [bacterium]|nr:roadblock/LC7 domain-containing protein [bacterium]